MRSAGPTRSPTPRGLACSTCEALRCSIRLPASPTTPLPLTPATKVRWTPTSGRSGRWSGGRSRRKRQRSRERFRSGVCDALLLFCPRPGLAAVPSPLFPWASQGVAGARKNAVPSPLPGTSWALRQAPAAAVSGLRHPRSRRHGHPGTCPTTHRPETWPEPGHGTGSPPLRPSCGSRSPSGSWHSFRSRFTSAHALIGKVVPTFPERGCAGGRASRAPPGAFGAEPERRPAFDRAAPAFAGNRGRRSAPRGPAGTGTPHWERMAPVWVRFWERG